MKYNIAIKLPGNIIDKSIEISQLVAGRGGIFTLGTQNNFPHISIAHFECDSEDNIEKIINDIIDILKRVSIFDINSDNYRVSKNGWVDVSFEMREEIIFIYEKIVEILNIYNCEITSDDWRRKNMPHITFSRMRSDDIFDVSILPKYDFSFIVDRIGLFERGAQGVCKKELKTFKLHLE